MALSMSVRFPVTPPATGHHPTSALRSKPAPVTTNHSPIQPRPLGINGPRRRNQSFLAIRAVDESETRGRSESETVESQPAESKVELSELGSEIKKAMEEKKVAAEKEEGLLSGVAEEVREIEWPGFGKVLGTTWVVLGVIAGSSVVLLTLNFVLAELSDKVFAGRGVQDFFS